MSPRYMLDTNMCIYLIKHQPREVQERFSQCYVGEVVMSSITYAELAFGVAVSKHPDRERSHLANLVEDIPVLPFDQAAGAAYGAVRLANRENKKDALDQLIASHAVACDLTLVTNNIQDFQKYPGLNIENWVDSSR